MCMFYFFFFFFFQAEDGIRDVAVTGVQTCALPISDGADARRGEIQRGRRPQSARAHQQHARGLELLLSLDSHIRKDEVTRSEERRVGKECRSRWSREQ